MNRLENFFLEKYFSLMKVTIKKQDTNHIIIIILHDQYQHQEIINTAFEKLKVKDGANMPTFHKYDPAAFLALEKLRILNVRNISLRITRQNLETFFKRHGLINNIKLCV